MSILKYKYKAHKFINYAFYVVVFIVGFLLGFSTEKINFNKLISQVLMIDNVSALTIVESGSLIVDEEYIYNAMFNETGYDFEDYSNLVCKYSYYVNSNTYGAIECTGFSSIDDLSITDYTTGSNSNFRYSYPANALRYSIRFRKSSGEIVQSSLGINTISGTSNFMYINGNGSTSNGTNKTYTNFDFINGSYLTTVNPIVNKLDFSKYAINLEFNENLFKDNPDFKEVCVNNYDTFSITSNEISSYGDDGSPQYHDFDFIWFQNGLAYLSAFQYDSESSTHINFYDDIENSFVGWGYWLDTIEEIDKHFSSDNPGLYLAFKGYEDKYSYYNWTFYPFEMTFTTDYHFYTIFSFNNSYLKQAGISTVVDNAYIKYLDGTIKEDSDQYCFYIKNEYDVNILNRNENGDFNSTITVLGGINKDDKTYELEMGRNTKGFFSTVNNFISKIRPTVIFINTHIFELYTSLPLIVRSFIISFLVLILIRILIGMVVR